MNKKDIQRILVVALFIPITYGATVRYLHEQNHTLIAQKDAEIASTENKLNQVVKKLEEAEKKLGFIEHNKTPVQVTAYTGGQGSKFANGVGVNRVYAVPAHTLPSNRVVSVALSPTAQRRLNAKMNDYIVLVHRRGQQMTLARFVDIMPDEPRPVVDVFFADSGQARVWGRRTDYYAVNLSSANSPFKAVLN